MKVGECSRILEYSTTRKCMVCASHLVLLTKSVAQESAGSSPHSQEPATGPYPELVEFTPAANLRKIHPPIYALVFQEVTFLQAFPP
jgi:hypothetical protein